MDNSSYIFRGLPLASILLTALIVYSLSMDVALYFRIRNHAIRTDGNMTFHPSHCFEYSPLCYVTVKGVLLDQINLYIISPLVNIFDSLFRISDFTLITPNMISLFHVFVAAGAAKCISSNSLSDRKIGVALFEIRTMLDGLDGHVARTRKHIRGEGSEVGSTGYIVDGVCDALGITFLMLGLYIFLKGNVSKREYLPLQEKTDFSEGYRKKMLNKRLLQAMGCVIGQLMLSSAAWNRYIALYQDLLEKVPSSPTVEIKQIMVFRSNYFLFIAFLWRLLNIHSYLHALLLAVLNDRIWEFIKNIMFAGFVALLALVCLSEMHILQAKEFIYGNMLFHQNITQIQ